MIPYGSLLLYVIPGGKKYIKKLEPGNDWHSADGILSASAAHEANFGSVLETSLGMPVRVEEATLFDRLMGLKRQTQIIYPKDIAQICLRLGAGPGRLIGEAGCGSGALTMALSWFCGPTGQVASQDSREEFVKLARRNLDWAGLGANVCLETRDVENGFAIKNADAIFMDMREPWLYLDQALAAAKPGASFGFLLPTSNQVDGLLREMEKKDFAETEVCEILLRHWKPLPDRLRPQDRMAAHTGFLVFSRQQDKCAEFDAWRPLGTRERKQARARDDRLRQAELPPDE